MFLTNFVVSWSPTIKWDICEIKQVHQKFGCISRIAYLSVKVFVVSCWKSAKFWKVRVAVEGSEFQFLFRFLNCSAGTKVTAVWSSLNICWSFSSPLDLSRIILSNLRRRKTKKGKEENIWKRKSFFLQRRRKRRNIFGEGKYLSGGGEEKGRKSIGEGKCHDGRTHGIVKR